MDFVISALLISVPEEAFMVAFILIFLGKTENLNFKRESIIKFFIPVLLSALTTSFLRTVVKLGLDDYVPFLGILLLFSSITLIYRLKGIKKIMQCLACTIIAVIIPILIQIAYIPVTMSIMRLSVADISKVNLGVLYISIPERVIELVIISVLILKKKSLIRINPFRVILTNKLMSAIFFVCIILNLLFIYVFTYAIYNERILVNLPIVTQLIAAIVILIIPIVNISSIIGVVYVLAYREKSKRLYMVEETKAVSALVSILSKRGNYKQIQDELKEFNQQINEIDKRKGDFI